MSAAEVVIGTMDVELEALTEPATLDGKKVCLAKGVVKFVPNEVGVFFPKKEKEIKIQAVFVKYQDGWKLEEAGRM